MARRPVVRDIVDFDTGVDTRSAAVGQSRRVRSTTTMRHVANRSLLPNAIDATNTHASWRSWAISFVPVSRIRVAIANWAAVNNAGTVSEVNAGGAQTCALSLEYPRGTFTRITWGDGGPASQVIADGDTGYAEMALPFTIPSFAWFRVAAEQTWAGAGRAVYMTYSNCCDRGNGDEFLMDTTPNDLTMVSTKMGSTDLTMTSGPLAIMAQSALGVWCIVADSIGAGANQFNFDPSGGRGLYGPALAKAGPSMNLSVGGDRCFTYISNSAKRRAVMAAAGVTDILLNLGRNDIVSAIGNLGAGTVLGHRDTIRAFWPGMTIADTTITPTTTSTDNWQTAVNQTIANATDNTRKSGFNDVLRQGIQTGSSGLIDVVAALETSTTFEQGPQNNGGVWIPRAMGRSDGVHPISEACRMVEPLIRNFIETRA